MYHVTTCALDQGGVEPRLAVSVRPEGHRQYHYTTAPAGVLLECLLAVLVVLVFCFGCLVYHFLCPKWLAMAAMWAMTPGSSGT